MPDVQDALPVGEAAGGASPYVSLFFVSLGVPRFQGASPVASPARLALAATLPCAGAADSADLTQSLWRAE